VWVANQRRPLGSAGKELQKRGIVHQGTTSIQPRI